MRRLVVAQVLGMALCACAWSQPAGAEDLGKPALPRIRIGQDGRTFATDDAKPFVPMGVTYYRPGTGWAPQVWKKFDAEATRQDFVRMKALGVNCVRVFLSYGSFYMEPDALLADGLGKFDQFLAMAEAAGEEQQARWCRGAVETTRGLATGWLNWGLCDHPEARDVSQLTGLLTVEGKPKAWASEFQNLAGALAGRPVPAARLGPRPALDWDRCTTSTRAGRQFREEYYKAFSADRPRSSSSFLLPPFPRGMVDSVSPNHF